MSDEKQDGSPDVEPNPTKVMERAETAALEDPSVGAIAAFSSMRSFEAAQRMAKALSASSLVPQQYRGNLANCLVAMELASRTEASVFMVMQNLDVIRGNPSWRAKFLIASVNSSGRFTPIRYEWQGSEGTDEWGCRAVATDKKTGQECVGPLVTIGLAKKEGWHGKKDSKWRTIPELMLMYRSGAWWTNVYCPELSLGMNTSDELRDVEAADVSGVVQEKTESRMAEMREELKKARGETKAPEPDIAQAEVDEPEGREGPDYEIVDDEDDEPSEYELAKQEYRAACKRARLVGEDRLDWQEEHLGERSAAKWSTDDYRKAAEMLQAGIGLEEQVETVTTDEPEQGEIEVPDDGTLPV